MQYKTAFLTNCNQIYTINTLSFFSFILCVFIFIMGMMNMLLRRFIASVKQINVMICVLSKDKEQSVHLISFHCPNEENMSFSHTPPPLPQ